MIRCLMRRHVNIFREQFPNCKVPTFEEACVLCLDLGLKIYIDIKGNAKQVVLLLSTCIILCDVPVFKTLCGFFNAAKELKILLKLLLC